MTAMTIALELIACSRPHSLFVDEPAQADASASPVNVVQADALIVDGRPIHLADAVTPQPAPKAGCPAEVLAARQARLRMAALAQTARHVSVTPTGTLDGDYRINAHVSFDGLDPAETLIDEGLAVAPRKQAFNWCSPRSGSQPRAQHLAMLSSAGS
jgi:endonuclease YncB( thermonuclease family)